VTDINDGDLPITGPYFTLTGVPAFPGSPATMTKVSDDGNHDAVMDPGETWIFSYTVNITTETSFTAVGHGMAGGSDITGPSETRTMVVSPPPVPASTNLGIALMILVFGGAIAIFGLQRRRRSQNS
jgi:hypothetical protein